jgi:hypothetical protein
MTVRAEDFTKPAAVTDERALEVVTMEEFSAVVEPGADALVGSGDDALIPEDGDVMIYGAGGAGKTSLALDLAVHLAAGDSWLRIPVPHPVRVLVIENEGPRPLFRRKLKRKLAGWAGSPLAGRVSVLQEPWAAITLTDPSWQAAVASAVRSGEVDVVIAGPVIRLGMDEAGTLQQVRDFMALINTVRSASGRRVAVILVHHENKGGAVSGAWEGAGDTLLHVEARGPGHTHLFVQKARWSSEHHGTTLDLAWADGEGFTVEDERNYVAEMVAYLEADAAKDATKDRPAPGWRTAKEISTPRDKPDGGIGAGVDTVKDGLEKNKDIFVKRNGKEVGRSGNATVYGLTLGQKSDESDQGSHRTAGTSDSHPLTPVGGGGESDTVPSPQTPLTSEPKSDGSENGHREWTEAELEALAAEHGERS